MTNEIRDYLIWLFGSMVKTVDLSPDLLPYGHYHGWVFVWDEQLWCLKIVPPDKNLDVSQAFVGYYANGPTASMLSIDPKGTIYCGPNDNPVNVLLYLKAFVYRQLVDTACLTVPQSGCGFLKQSDCWRANGWILRAKPELNSIVLTGPNPRHFWTYASRLEQCNPEDMVLVEEQIICFTPAGLSYILRHFRSYIYLYP